MTGSYTIRSGVYFAAVQGEGVIMDLVQDRYYGLEPDSAAIWSALQAGCAPELIAERVSATSPDVDLDMIGSQLEAWAEANLVTDETGEAAEIELPRLRLTGSPAQVRIVEQMGGSTFLSWLMVPQLIRRARWSRRALRHHGICWTLKQIQAIGGSPASEGWRWDATAHRMLVAYHSCRRILSQGTDDCLIRSLALTAALRGISVDAEFCFGVQKFPFLAHAWVEVDGKVANEDPMTIQKYTILARF